MVISYTRTGPQAYVWYVNAEYTYTNHATINNDDDRRRRRLPPLPPPHVCREKASRVRIYISAHARPRRVTIEQNRNDSPPPPPPQDRNPDNFKTVLNLRDACWNSRQRDDLFALRALCEIDSLVAHAFLHLGFSSARISNFLIEACRHVDKKSCRRVKNTPRDTCAKNEKTFSAQRERRNSPPEQKLRVGKSAKQQQLEILNLQHTGGTAALTHPTIFRYFTYPLLR